MNAILERAMAVTEEQKKAFHRKYASKIRNERKRERIGRILDATQMIVIIALFDAVIIAALLVK